MVPVQSPLSVEVAAIAVAHYSVMTLQVTVPLESHDVCSCYRGRPARRAPATTKTRGGGPGLEPTRIQAGGLDRATANRREARYPIRQSGKSKNSPKSVPALTLAASRSRGV